MRRISIAELGLAADVGMVAANRSRVIPIKHKIFGVAIANDSDIDQCGIAASYPGEFNGYQQAANGYLTDDLTDIVMRGAAAEYTKIGVGAAFIGEIDTPQIVVAATRGVRAAVSLGSQSPQLTLDLAETPSEAIALAARTRRAPLDLDIGVSLGNSGTRVIAFPTYGRRWWSFAMQMDSALGTWVLEGHTEPLYRLAGGNAGYTGLRTSKVVTALHTEATTAGDESIEADTSYDRIWLTMSATGNCNFVGHFRAED